MTSMQEQQVLCSVLLKMAKGEKPFDNTETPFIGALAGYEVTCTKGKDNTVIIKFDKL